MSKPDSAARCATFIARQRSNAMTESDAWHHNWSDVDSTSDPRFFVSFLDETRRKMVRIANLDPAKFFSYLDLVPGDSLLDIGCGTGDLLHPIESLVGSDGRVVGCDYSSAMIDEARRRAERWGSRVEFIEQDVHALSFSDATFDRCTAMYVFQHLVDPGTALCEIARVLKPGGRVFLTETDWETQVVDSPDVAVTRKIMHFFCDGVRAGGVARTLPALCREAGLTDIQVTADCVIEDGRSSATLDCLRETARRAASAGIVTRPEMQAWLDDQEARLRDGRFFSTCATYRVSGCKP
jgi:2-polyprenyl-3-methyl-5-hydroxy-6-metoxy-1,4-benzoquinol methylase